MQLENVDMIDQGFPLADELTEVQNSLLRYVKTMTKVIGKIELESGLFPAAGELDMSESAMEQQRLQGLQVAEPLSVRDVNATAREVMQQYESLQRHIKNLNGDFDKDEAELLQEVKVLEERNRQSLKAYRDVHTAAHDASEQLTKIV